MPVSYILEVRDGSQVLRAVHLPFVNRYTHARTSATDFAWTFGDRPYMSHSGIREQRITLGGVSGYQATLGWDRDGNRRFADGPTLFREFEAFLQGFERETKAQQESGNPNMQLVFRAEWEGHHLLVDPIAFQWDRQTSDARHTYKWSLELRAYGVDDSRLDSSILGDIQAGAQAAADAIDSVTAYVAEATETLQDVQATLDAFTAPIRAVTRMAQQVGTLAGAAGGILRWPQDLAQQVFVAAQAGALALYRVWEALPGVDRAPARAFLLDALADMREVRRTVLYYLGSTLQRAGGEQPIPGATPPRPGRVVAVAGKAVRYYRPQTGESLQDIAQRFLSDSSRWVEVARLNGMSNPWTLPDGMPIGPTWMLKVPILAADDGQLVGASATDAMGTDLRVKWDLDGEWDLVWKGTDDVELVSGDDNLLQALRLRLTTTQGHSVFSRYGIPDLVGRPNVAGTTALLSAHVREQLLADPRVAEVLSLEVVDVGDAQDVTSTVKVIGGTTVTTIIPVEAQ